MWLIVTARLDVLHPIAKPQHSTVLACMNYTSFELPSPGWTFSDVLLIGSSAARPEATPDPKLAGWLDRHQRQFAAALTPHAVLRFRMQHPWTLTSPHLSNHPWELFGTFSVVWKRTTQRLRLLQWLFLYKSANSCVRRLMPSCSDKRVVVNYWSAIAQHLAVAKGCWSAIILLWSRVGGRLSCCGGQLCLGDRSGSISHAYPDTPTTCKPRRASSK